MDLHQTDAAEQDARRPDAAVQIIFSTSRAVTHTTIGYVRFSSGRCRHKRCYSRSHGYDADWIGELGRKQGAWANIPPKRNRKDPIWFNPNLYRVRNLIERFFNKIKQCRVSQPDTTSSQPIIWPSSNSHQSEFGYPLMSPRSR